MRLLLSSMALLAGLGLLMSACGSGDAPDDRDREDASTGTVRTERAERDASIMEQQQVEQAGEQETAEVGEEIDETGVIDFGHREGLPFTRNVVGDPEAPVLIVEYSDFQ